MKLKDAVELIVSCHNGIKEGKDAFGNRVSVACDTNIYRVVCNKKNGETVEISERLDENVSGMIETRLRGEGVDTESLEFSDEPRRFNADNLEPARLKIK